MTPFAEMFVVLGGAGAMGRVVARDLFESNRRCRIVIADRDEEGAQVGAESFRSARVTAEQAEIGSELARVLRGADVVINCTHHTLNIPVMDAALTARVHYVDLGGLFHWTLEQLKLDDEFKRAGLTAVIGMGCEPGITNVLARMGADKLGGVDSVEIRVGGRELGPARRRQFSWPYSPKTILQELTLKPAVFERGCWRFAAPRSGREVVAFPAPVGKREVFRTLHSEVATLPMSLRGLWCCDFKIAFDPDFVRWALAGERGRPARSVSHPEGGQDARAPRDIEVARVIVRRGRRVVTLDCIARSHPSWAVSAGDVDTAVPASVVAQMIASGDIRQRGVLPPEKCVPPEAFLAELRRRGMQIVQRD